MSHSSETDERVPSNLYPSHSPFFGRGEELATASEILRERQILTLTGEPGIGKSRLGREIARTYCPRPEQGPWVVAVPGQASVDQLRHDLAAVLAPRRNPLEGAAKVIEGHLAGTASIILIDQADRSLNAAREFAKSLVAVGPGVRVIVASRFPLECEGEQVLRLGPLDLPESQRELELRGLAAFGGTKLFLDRLQRLDRERKVLSKDAAAIWQLCRLLGGNPSSIILAASLAAAEGLERAYHWLQPLEDRSIGPGESLLQPTARRAIETLSQESQEFVARLSVFCADWSLAAASFVAAKGDSKKAQRLLSLLSSAGLVELGFNQEGQGRFCLAEPVLAELDGTLSPSAAIEAEKRHIEFFAKLTIGAGMQIAGKEIGEGLGQLAAEYPNVKLALVRALAAEDPAAIEMVPNLAVFWQRTRPHEEARDLALNAAELAESMPASTKRGRAMNVAAGFLVAEGDFVGAERWATRALDASTRSDDASGSALAHANLALISKLKGDLAQAYLEGSKAAELFLESQEPRRLVACLSNLGIILEDQGRHEEAIERLTEAIRIADSIEDEWSATRAESNLSEIYIRLGKPVQALKVARQSLQRGIRSKDYQTVALSLEHSGVAAARLHEPESATTLIAFAQLVREEHGLIPTPQQEATVTALTEELAAALDPNLFDDRFRLAEETTLPEVQEWLELLILQHTSG